ncbi:MAG: DUF4923 family protein [Muribaculaceae bacterium]|nr:DUF4923 family protein [Muribaculaceae bacterium]
MRKFFILAVTLFACGVMHAAGFDPKDILNGLKGTGSASQQTEGSTSDNDSNGGGILGALGGFINNIAANSKFSVDDLVGTWDYTSPAVSFKSENALMNIGGAGAATAVESKLEPYYNRLGFNKTTLTVAEDHTFILKLGLIQLKGTVEKDTEDTGLVFNFSAFGKISLGKVSANATKAGNTLNLTFEATKLVQLLTKISSVLNSTALNTLSSLLNSYDDIYIGFKLKKTANASATTK